MSIGILLTLGQEFQISHEEQYAFEMAWQDIKNQMCPPQQLQGENVKIMFLLNNFLFFQLKIQGEFKLDF